MVSKVTVFVLCMAFLATPLLAQEPGGGEEEFDLLGAVKKVDELLAEAESLLVRTLTPKKEATPEEAAETGREAREAIDELLRRSEASGRDASKTIMDILENAPRSKGNSTGEDKEGDPSEKDDEKRKAGEKKVDDRDPQNSKSGEPKGGKKDPSKPTTGPKPPTKKGDPRRPDPSAEWLASLPEQVRQAYLNKDWGRIPPKWQEHIKAYMKRLAEAESSGGD